MKVQIDRVSAALRTPFVSASGAVDRRELLLLRLEAADGYVGLGEASPLPSYDGVGVDECQAALEDCRPALSASDGSDRQTLLARCVSRAVLPQAIAAVDLALWDMVGRRAGRPVWQLLGATRPPPIAVNCTVFAPDRAGASAEAASARRAGYGTIKLKAGIGDDAGRVAAVRAAAGPEMAIRLDANGAWSVPEAEAALRALAPAGIELCEEPVHGIDQIAALDGVAAVPLALDETAAAPGALDRRLCQAVCLKISRCGGITGVTQAARRAREAGYQVYLASTLDGPVGIAAALSAAAVLRPDRACGLATLQLFAGREDPLPPSAGRMCVPVGPGLGDSLLDWYGV